jgi:hypothetical protein
MKLSAPLLLLLAQTAAKPDSNLPYEEEIHSLNLTGVERQLDEAGHRHLKSRELEVPECVGEDVYDCRNAIRHHIDTYGGHVLSNLQLVILNAATEDSKGKYWMYDVASNFEVMGQSQCQLNGGAATPRASEWEYADGSTVALEDVQCRGMTNAECCDAIWRYGEQLGPDTNGNQLMCTVSQEPMYPFFVEENGRNLVKYPDYVIDETGVCTNKNYRAAVLQRQYAKLAYAIDLEVIQKIDHLLGPTAMTGYCSDAQGNDQNSQMIVLRRGVNFGPQPERQQACLKMCQDYEIENGIEIQGCEPIWRHGGRGCYAFKTEVTQSSGEGRRRACFVDPIRPEQFEETCTYLKDLVDNIYNYARMEAVMEATGQIKAEYCTNGDETFAVTADLVTLLTTIKDAAAYTGATPIPVINVIYIVGDENLNVISVPKVATNNPAFNPVLSDEVF